MPTRLMELDAGYVDPATGAPRPGAPLGALLTAQASRAPDRPAVTFGEITWSFLDLDQRANRRARQLAEQGLRQGDRIVVSLPNSVEFIDCCFAVWKLGATVCPVSHRLLPEELTAIMALAGPAAILVGTAGPRSERTIIITGAPPPSLSDQPLPPCSTRPGRILCSGGSTGRPKLIVDPSASSWGPEKVGYRRPSGCTVMSAGPLYHSSPFSNTLYPIAQGSHAVCMERFDAEEWLRAIARHRVEYVNCVPTMMTRAMKLEPAVSAEIDLSSVKVLIHMASPCPHETKRWWIRKLGADKVLELYGGTERIGLTLITGDEWLEHPGSVGQASPGDEIVISDESGRELPSGEIGEVHFRKSDGPGKTYEYIGAASRLSGDLDSYGDMGWLDDDGYLYIADRRTDMVVVGGVNVYPAEVEAILDSMPGVMSSAVIGLPDPDRGNRLHAIVELEGSNVAPDSRTFLANLGEHLKGPRQVRSVEFTHDRIRDDAGKVRRSALRDARLPSAGADRSSG